VPASSTPMRGDPPPRRRPPDRRSRVPPIRRLPGASPDQRPSRELPSRALSLDPPACRASDRRDLPACRASDQVASLGRDPRGGPEAGRQETQVSGRRVWTVGSSLAASDVLAPDRVVPPPAVRESPTRRGYLVRRGYRVGEHGRAVRPAEATRARVAMLQQHVDRKRERPARFLQCAVAHPASGW
jgi:hypothetical protein